MNLIENIKSLFLPRDQKLASGQSEVHYSFKMLSKLLPEEDILPEAESLRQQAGLVPSERFFLSSGEIDKIRKVFGDSTFVKVYRGESEYDDFFGVSIYDQVYSDMQTISATLPRELYKRNISALAGHQMALVCSGSAFVNDFRRLRKNFPKRYYNMLGTIHIMFSTVLHPGTYESIRMMENNLEDLAIGVALAYVGYGSLSEGEIQTLSFEGRFNSDSKLNAHLEQVRELMLKARDHSANLYRKSLRNIPDRGKRQIIEPIFDLSMFLNGRIVRRLDEQAPVAARLASNSQGLYAAVQRFVHDYLRVYYKGRANVTDYTLLTKTPLYYAEKDLLKHFFDDKIESFVRHNKNDSNPNTYCAKSLDSIKAAIWDIKVKGQRNDLQEESKA